MDQSGLSVLTGVGVLSETATRTWLLIAEGGWEGIVSNPFLPLLFIGLFLYFLVIRPERRRQGSHRQMLDGMKRNDRIVTIGGIRGTVVSVNREADEVVIRVDDNVKLSMTVGAIARIEGDDAKKSEGT